MGKFKDITGQRFGRLVVLRRRGSDAKGQAMWICQCQCGITTVVRTSDLNNGNSRSCGCGIREQMKRGLRLTHGMSGTPEHRIWKHMMGRCYTPTDHKYPIYGGRGITIDVRWHRFENFLADMGPRPSPIHSIERVDNHGPYSPQNCIWADIKTQARNKRTVLKYSYYGQVKTLPEWAEITGISRNNLYHRIVTLKWPVSLAFTIRVKKKLSGTF